MVGSDSARLGGMDSKQCGRSGLYLSSIGLGTLTWGRDTDAPEALEMLTHFVDAGGSLLECSPSHGDGMAVDVVSEAVASVGRHRVVLAWRGGMRRATEGAWVGAAGRGDLLRSLDDALARLDTDYVDVWLVEPRPEVPLEETLEAATLAYRSGRARYVGLSRSSHWQLAEAVTRGAVGVSAPITLVEFPFSLVDAACAPTVAELASRGVGVLAASALAGGALTGKYRHTTPADSRAASPHLRHMVEPYLSGFARSVIEATHRAASGLDRPTGDVALAWVRDYPGISSALVGPRTARQLDTLLEYTATLPAPIREVLSEVAQ